MLVMMRDRNEAVLIDLRKYGVAEPVQVVLVETRGSKARLGFIGPRDIPIHRKEVYEAIERNKANESEDPTELEGGEAA